MMFKSVWSGIKSATKSVVDTLRFSKATNWFGTNEIPVKWGNHSYNHLVKLGMKNPIARRAIKFIGDSMADIELQLVSVNEDGETEEIGEHPALDILRSPGGIGNNRYTKEWLFKGFVWAMMGGGEFWIRSISPDGGMNAGQPQKLRLYDSSDFMEFLTDRTTGFVEGYRLREERPNLHTTTIEGDTDEILHAFNYNPLNKFRGFSILYSVMRQLELISEGEDWNKAIAESKGQIPGFFKPTGLDAGQQLDKTTRQQAQEQVDEHINNSRKGNKWHVLGGAYDPVERNVSPQDAEWLEGSQYFGRLVSTGIGIDPVLIGDDSAKSYNNYITALLVAYVGTILPLFGFFLSALNRWYIPKFFGDERVRLTYDPMEITALEEQNLQKIERVQKAVGGPIFTPDEGRQIVDYDKLGVDELLLKFNVQTHSQLFQNQEIDGEIDNITGVGDVSEEEAEKQIKAILNGSTSNGHT